MKELRNPKERSIMEFEYLISTISFTDILQNGNRHNLTHLQELGATPDELHDRMISMIDKQLNKIEFDYDDMTSIHIKISKMNNNVDTNTERVHYELTAIVDETILFEEYFNQKLDRFFVANN